MALDNDSHLSGTAAKQKKGSKDDGISVTMLTVEEVSYKIY